MLDCLIDQLINVEKKNLGLKKRTVLLYFRDEIIFYNFQLLQTLKLELEISIISTSFSIIPFANRIVIKLSFSCLKQSSSEDLFINGDRR